jgi:Domain of unknown function (DUF4832)/Domain of unknown function (DUF4874)
MQSKFFSRGLFALIFPVLPSLAGNPSFMEDTTNFANPERGYFITTTATVNSTNLLNARKQGMTLIRKYYNIVSFSGTDSISKEYLDNIAKDAQVLRQSGAKIIPRFQFNCGGCPTATPERILKHIEDISQVLRENSDVIAYIEMGFLGMCGEWHCGGGNYATKDIRQSVVDKLLEGLPDRMIALRYNRFKRDLYGNTPLSPDLAFNGSNRARIGAHNDCFMYSVNDRGTYDDEITKMSIEDQKSYLNLDNRYVPQGGESCDNASYGTCPRTLADLKRMHWDALNSTFFTPLIGVWESEGCNSDIKKLLGYRLKVTGAQIQDSVQPGKSLSAKINLTNLGWGKIYNYRSAEFVLRNIETKNEIKIKLNADLREWTKTDSINNVNLTGLVPATLPEGPYSLYLNLPDTSSNLAANPAYSVRLANKNVWEETTGYNFLFDTVIVSKKASVSLSQSLNTKVGFKLTGKKNKDLYSFEVQSPENGEAEFEILTLSGKRMLTQKLSLIANKKSGISWKPPFEAIFLVRVHQGNYTHTIHAKI